MITREALQRWVDYARAHEAVILYDAAYEAYIRDPDIPHSIYEIEGAREVAIESRSFSKNAGLHGHAAGLHGRAPGGARAAPRTAACTASTSCGCAASTKSNGPPYVVQRAAAAVYTPDGAEAGARAHRLLHGERARHPRRPRRGRLHGLRRAQRALHLGRTPAGVSSWDFFDRLLAEAHVVGAPGSGFGPSGEGYFRLTAFGSREQTEEAVERIRTRMRP